MRVKHVVRGLLAAVIASLAVFAVACGSGNDSADGGSSASDSKEASSNPAVQQARATVEKYSADQPAIGIPAMSKKPPAGKRFALMGCPLPVCKLETDGATDGAKALGWNVTLYTTPLTPEGYAQTWNRMLDDNPDVLAYLGFVPKAVVTKQLATLAARKTPTVVYAPNGYGPSPDAPPQAAVSGAPAFSTDGKLMGAQVVADSDGKAKAVFVNDPSSAYWLAAEQAFTKEVEGAGGTVEQLKVSQTGIGKTIPASVVSYLQRHPDVKYVALALNDFAVGLSAALKGAGLANKVKVISRAPTPANMTEIVSGDQWASVADENIAAGWRITDALARMAVGDEIAACCRFPDGWHQIFTKDNAKANAAPQTPGVPDAFLTAWHTKGT